jgi:isopentenyl diphosphate isomerase/L-lactate dehydrogenase-like FMN-dependent dehydrogenase
VRSKSVRMTFGEPWRQRRTSDRGEATGFTGLMQTEGEVAGAWAAARHGIPFSLWTLGTASIEAVAAANPLGRNWFQQYM